MNQKRQTNCGLSMTCDTIRLEPDVAPDAEAVNEALRFLIRVTREKRDQV